MSTRKRYKNEALMRCVEVYPDRVLKKESTKKAMDMISELEEVEEVTLIEYSKDTIGRIWIKLKSSNQPEVIIGNIKKICKRTLPCEFNIYYPPMIFVNEGRIISDSREVGTRKENVHSAVS